MIREELHALLKNKIKNDNDISSTFARVPEKRLTTSGRRQK